MSDSKEIILCQPDSRKGCSVCCGLFNMLDCSREALAGFLEGGETRERTLATYENHVLSQRVRDPHAHVCPYQGFLSAGRPGCHIHPLSSGVEGRDRSLFSCKICSSFLCPAHVILSSGEKMALIRHVNDWYLYSAAIADPESFLCMLHFIMNEYGIRMDDDAAGTLLNAGLEAHAGLLTSGDGTIFHYSRPEYMLHREEFCIKYNEERRNSVLAIIKDAARAAGL